MELRRYKSWKWLWLALGFAVLVACRHHPSTTQLEAWHQEAVAENQRLTDAYVDTSQQRQWSLVIQGQTLGGKPKTFSWEELQTLATTHVPTREPHQFNDKTINDFRGVPVIQLLAMAGVDPSVREVTFIATDAYRATVSLADLKRYPIVLAVERDGEPIPRAEGGPLYLVFPITQFPNLSPKYPGTHWVFYVTNVVAGTESTHLKVGQRLMKAADLEQLPQVTLNTPVDYRLFWPNGKIQLQGVRIKDVLAATGIPLTPQTLVTVRGKAQIHRDASKSIRLTSTLLEACDVILATRWGDKLQPIPSQMGGPLTLALAPNCPVQKNNKLPWVVFVEELEVTTP